MFRGGAARLILALATVTCACSSNGTSNTAPEGGATDAGVEAGPKSPTAGLIAFGSTGLVYDAACDTQRMTKNALQALAGKQQGISILMTSEAACDPRTASDSCGLVSMDVFFSMINEIGTIKFRPVTDDLSPYDVVIAEYCRGNVKGSETVLQEYIRSRGGVLVLADNACRHADVHTTTEANVLVSRYGITLSTTEDPMQRGCGSVPAEEQVDLLAGVASVNIFRWVPVTAASPARGYVHNGAGKTLAAVYERTLP